jgi:3-deoxy-7-phosphoheptulonate synthase
MMIIMRAEATKKDVSVVVGHVESVGLRAHIVTGDERTVIGAIGDGRTVHKDQFFHLPGVDRVLPISRPYKLASREFRHENSVFSLDGVQMGANGVVLIAGPCSVESRSQIIETAIAVKEAGAHVLRGGAFKPRTSPYSFQGLGVEGMEYLAEAREITGMPVVSEVMSKDQISVMTEYIDVLQIGARNMQNYSLLHAVGECQHPVLLKRGMMASVEELLMAAEYILSHGNQRIILCERGIRTFETSTRFTTDINAVPVLKMLTHLPVIIDPSHGTGHWEYVSAVARAGIAAGADGLIIEVHPEPGGALSDGAQSLKPARFAKLVEQVKSVAEAVGRSMASVSAKGVVNEVV